MKPYERYTPAPNIFARELGNEIVILNLQTGTYFGLNPVGARLWQLIEEGCSFSQYL